MSMIHGETYLCINCTQVLNWVIMKYKLETKNAFIIYYEPCPTELPVMMKIFYTCTVQYGNYEPHIATQHLNCDLGDERAEF